MEQCPQHIDHQSDREDLQGRNRHVDERGDFAKEFPNLALAPAFFDNPQANLRQTVRVIFSCHFEYNSNTQDICLSSRVGVSRKHKRPNSFAVGPFAYIFNCLLA
jgi:hypothetical protein